MLSQCFLMKRECCTQLVHGILLVFQLMGTWRFLGFPLRIKRMLLLVSSIQVFFPSSFFKNSSHYQAFLWEIIWSLLALKCLLSFLLLLSSSIDDLMAFNKNIRIIILLISKDFSCFVPVFNYFKSFFFPGTSLTFN